MAKEKQQASERQGAEPEVVTTSQKFGNYSQAFMDAKLKDVMCGSLKLTGINNVDFVNFLMGYGFLKLQNRIDKLEKELGL